MSINDGQVSAGASVGDVCNRAGVSMVILTLVVDRLTRKVS